jgi:uncharacterized membrane protein YfcA
MEPWIYPVAIIGGFAAGFINTLAGNGSAITLTILMELMGLPPNIANATNRVGIFFQSMVSTKVFHDEGKIEWTSSLPYIIAVFLGAMVGLWLAVTIEDKDFKMVYGTLMVVMFFVVLVKPKRWIQPSEGKSKLPFPVLLLGFFLLGIYGGFIQMGMGIMFLAFTVLIGKFDIIRANALKIICVGAYTGVVLSIFAWHGLVDWKAGGLIAIGQVLGALICSKFAATHPLANVVAHRVLVAVVLFAIVKIFFFSNS